MKQRKEELNRVPNKQNATEEKMSIHEFDFELIVLLVNEYLLS